MYQCICALCQPEDQALRQYLNINLKMNTARILCKTKEYKLICLIMNKRKNTIIKCWIHSYLEQTLIYAAFNSTQNTRTHQPPTPQKQQQTEPPLDIEDKIEWS